jgi:diguanylate cyclase (GGDEF)-like protein
MTAVLVIDDSGVARHKIIDTLRDRSLFDFYLEAEDGSRGMEVLLNHPVDVVLCDMEMPVIGGLKFLEMRNGKEELRDVPVILLTGHEDRESMIRGLEEGASDYIAKPFDERELVARVKVQLKIKSLQDSLKRSNLLLYEQSNTDPLTGLCNRRCFMEAMSKEFNRSSRAHTPLSLVMADIDHFKKINDSYGHQQGDAVLVDVADLLSTHLREYDKAARFGGEEFALIFPEADIPQAVEVAERIRTETAALSFDGKLKNLHLTVSLGVATYPRGGISSVDDLIREADSALYTAKRSGRNRVETMRLQS